jgi:MATE family multidrug resistance protein
MPLPDPRLGSTPAPLGRERFARIFLLALPIAATEVPVVATIAIDTVLLGRLGARGRGRRPRCSRVPVRCVNLRKRHFLGWTRSSVQVLTQTDTGVEECVCGRACTCLRPGYCRCGRLPFVGTLLRALGQDPAVADEASWYLYGVAPDLPLLLVAIGLRGLVAVQIPASRLFPIAAVSVVPKIGLAIATWLLLIRTPLMANLPRVLLACGVTSLLTFACMGVSAWRAYRRAAPVDRLQFEPTMVADGAIRLLRRGLTIGAATSLQTGFFTVIAMLCGRCGTTALAAHQVANQCTLLPLMLAFGMSQAVATLTAEAVGGNNTGEAGARAGTRYCQSPSR